MRTKTITGFVWVLLGTLSAAPASAQYTARCAELTKAVEGLGLPDAERQKVTTNFDTYCKYRSQCLVSVKSAIEKAGPTAKLADTWPDCITKPNLDALQQGINAVTDEQKKKTLDNALWFAEGAFYTNLNNAFKTVATARDEVVNKRGEVEKFAAAMRDTKWPAVLALSDRFCTELGNVASYPWYQKANDAIGEEAALMKSTIDKLMNYLAMNPNSDTRPKSEVRKFIQSLPAAIEAGAVKVSGFLYGRREKQALFGGAGIYELYTGLKNEVNTFIYSYKGKEEGMTPAVTALGSFAGSATGGDDAKRWVADTLPALTKVADEYKAALEAFLSQHDKSVTSLMDRVSCAPQWRALRSKMGSESELIRTLAATVKGMQRYFDVSSGEARTELESDLGSPLARLAREVERVTAELEDDKRVIDNGLNAASRN